MGRLGKVSFQSNDESDLFLEADVEEESDPMDLPLELEEEGFDGSFPWETGRILKITPVNVNGDIGVIYGWFKGDVYDYPYMLTIYLEYEEEEQIEEETKE